MVRTIPADRFPAVVAAAARAFISNGYQRTQVQDVADALGLAKGTLYGYAQGKAALFTAAVRYADGHDPLPELADLPVPAQDEAAIAALVAGRLAGEIADLKLAQALIDPLPANATADLRVELTDIVTDLYARLAHHRIAIKLVDRCAPELPELAEVWFGTGRQAQVNAFEEYLLRREAAGTASLPGPASLVARTIVELCALWAVHCHFDPAPGSATPGGTRSVDDTAVAAMVAELVVRAVNPPLN